MNLVDSSAWLSFFADDHNANRFSKPIADLDNLVVPTIILTEVFKHVCRHRDEEAALAVVAHMEQGRVVPLDSGLAISAANVGIAHKLPLADSIIFATARRFEATLWTQDSDFEGLPRVKFFPRKR